MQQVIVFGTHRRFALSFSLSLSLPPPSSPPPALPAPFFRVIFRSRNFPSSRHHVYRHTFSLSLSREREPLLLHIFFFSFPFLFVLSNRKVRSTRPISFESSSFSKKKKKRWREREREGCETSNSLLHSGRGRRRCEKRRFWQEDPWRARSARREERFGTKGRRSAREQRERERERRVDRRTSNRTGIFVCPLFRPCFFFPSFFFFFFFPLVERALAALRRVEKKARFFPRYTSVLFALWNACYR